MAREAGIESYFCQAMLRVGALAVKVGHSGWPDRLVLLGNGEHFWAELKQEKGRLRAAQEIRIEDLEQLGDRTFVIRSRADADALAAKIHALRLSGAGRLADGAAKADGGAAEDGPRQDGHHLDRAS